MRKITEYLCESCDSCFEDDPTAVRSCEVCGVDV